MNSSASKTFVFISSVLVLWLATGCGTTIVQLQLPSPNVSHGIQGKSGEFSYAIKNGPDLVTTGRAHQLIPDFSASLASKAVEKGGPESIVLLYCEGCGWFGRDNLMISKQAGSEWLANALEAGLRQAGYQPKRVAAANTAHGLALEVVFQRASGNFEFKGASTQIIGSVVLEARILKEGKEIKKATFEGKSQEGVHFGTTAAWDAPMSYALGDALMQTFRMVRDIDNQ